MKIITNTHGRFLSTKQKLSEAKGKEEIRKPWQFFKCSFRVEVRTMKKLYKKINVRVGKPLPIQDIEVTL